LQEFGGQMKNISQILNVYIVLQNLQITNYDITN